MPMGAAPIRLMIALAVAVAGCKGSETGNEQAADQGDDQTGTFTCKDLEGDTCVGATDQFAATADVIYLLYKTKDLPDRGTEYVIQWIAEDIGPTAQANMVIETLEHEVEDPSEQASVYAVKSSLTKPTKGWPPGKYRIEVKLGGKLLTTARFSIKGEPPQMGTFTCKGLEGQKCVGATDQFATTDEVVHLLYRTKDVPEPGDVYVIQWIAEDVGSAAPANTVIGTVNEKVDDPVDSAGFYVVKSYFTKPTRGWPPGKYRIEVKSDGKLLTTARFSIK